MRILIAEDDAVSRELLLKALAPLGDCDVATDGIEAVEAIIKAYEAPARPYDILLLDIMMPRVDGIMALRAIRDAERQMKIPPEKKLRVVIFSALNEEQARATGLNAAYEVYLEKPVDLVKLYDIVKKLCSN